MLLRATLALMLTMGGATAQTPVGGKRVAVLPVQTGKILDVSEKNYLTKLLRGRAGNALTPAGLVVMDRENFQAILGADISLEDCLGTCIVDTGTKLQAHYVVSAELTKVFGEFRLTISAHETKSKVQLRQVVVEIATKIDFERAIKAKTPELFESILTHHSGGGSIAMGNQRLSARIFVQVLPKNATITLNGAPISNRKMTKMGDGFLLDVVPNQKFVVGAQAQNRLARRQEVYVRPGAIQTVQIDLPRRQRGNETCQADGCLTDLTVKSAPPDAEVWIDGERTPHRTAPSIGDPNLGQVSIRVNAGTRVVEVRKPEYERAKVTMDVKLGDLNATPTLQLKPNYGALLVRSTPSGALVKIDGKTQLERTPLTIPKLASGPHGIVIELDDYYTSDSSVFVKRGQSNTHDVKLKPTFGQVEIQIREGQKTPSRLTIVLNDTQTVIAENGRVVIDRLTAGPHTIRVLDPLYEPTVESFSVDEGEKVRVTLDAVGRYGFLNLEAPEGISGQAFVDRKPASLDAVLQVQAGTHTVRFVPDDQEKYSVVESTITVGLLENTAFNFEEKARKGTVFVLSNPAGADVYLSREYLGKTPLKATVFQGRYELVWKARGYDDVGQNITVKENEMSRFEVKLGQRPTAFVTCVPALSDVWFDGARVGSSPQTIVSTAGRHEVSCNFEGATTAQDVELAQGVQQELNLIVTQAQLTDHLAELAEERKFTGVLSASAAAVTLGLSAYWAYDFQQKETEANRSFSQASLAQDTTMAQNLFSNGNDIADQAEKSGELSVYSALASVGLGVLSYFAFTESMSEKRIKTLTIKQSLPAAASSKPQELGHQRPLAEKRSPAP